LVSIGDHYLHFSNQSPVAMPTATLNPPNQLCDYVIADKVVPRSAVSTREPTPGGATVGLLVEAPTYRPSDELFEEPIGYIRLLHGDASPSGIGCVIPPDGWQVPA
jgi:hypothetical protein